MELVILFFLFVLALIGVPIFVVMSIGGLALFTVAEVDISAVSIEIYRLASTHSVMTIPLFTFAGYLLAESNSPKRLLILTRKLLGWMPGGIAIVSLVICAFFTAFTGASGVTIIALGGLIFPILIRQGYSEDFSLGLVTTSGSLGLLFPPSLPLILYGIMAKVDIDALFVAGIVPGFLLIGVLSLYSWVKSPMGSQKFRKEIPVTEEHHVSYKEALWQARLELPLPFLVLGGIYSGFLTVTESASFTALYCLFIVTFGYGDLSFRKDIPKVAKESMSLVGSILIILCCALGVTNYLVDEEIPLMMLESVQGIISNKYIFLLFLNIFLLMVGALMDIFSAIIIVLPLILPIAESFDVHPVHLAIIFLTNLEIGYITPPVGINLFISSFRFKRPVLSLYKASFPFLLLLLVALMIITYVPTLSLMFVE